MQETMLTEHMVHLTWIIPLPDISDYNEIHSSIKAEVTACLVKVLSLRTL